MSAARRRSVAEWVSFAVSVAVLVTIVGLVTAQLLSEDRPAAPVATPAGAVRVVGDRYFVPVRVANEGDLTAADVQVTAELTIGSEQMSGDMVVPFLAGGATAELVFAFDADPADGELTVAVTGYAEP